MGTVPSKFQLKKGYCLPEKYCWLTASVASCLHDTFKLVSGHQHIVPEYVFSPTAESFGVSAQIGSGVVRGGPEVRFHEGSTRVPPGFHQGSTRVPPGFHQGSTRAPPGFHEGSARFCEGCGVVRALKRAPHAVGDMT